ncbi:rootletin-like [Macaca mulatta]
MQSDLDEADLSATVTELGLAVECLQKQNLEKDQVNKDLTEKLEALESLRLQEQAALETEDGEGLQQTLRDLAQRRPAERLQVSPSREPAGEALGPVDPVPTAALLARPRSFAPPRPLSPACSDSSKLALIHSALHKCQPQVQAHEDAQREVQRLRSANELLSREKSNLAHSLQVAQQQAEELRQEREKLQAAQEELRRQRDRLEEEQEDAVQDGARVRRELERSHRQLEQLGGKRSVLAKELVEVREALSRATLQRDMLQAEKAEVAEALTKAEAGRVELELSMTKLRAEEASLQDSLSKLSALNESLAQDKLDLNHLVAQGLQSSRHTAGGGGTSVQRSTVVFSPEHGHPNQGCKLEFGAQMVGWPDGTDKN